MNRSLCVLSTKRLASTIFSIFSDEIDSYTTTKASICNATISPVIVYSEGDKNEFELRIEVEQNVVINKPNITRKIT